MKHRWSKAVVVALGAFLLAGGPALAQRKPKYPVADETAEPANVSCKGECKNDLKECTSMCKKHAQHGADVCIKACRQAEQECKQECKQSERED